VNTVPLDEANHNDVFEVGGDQLLAEVERFIRNAVR
jgi:hypothetical protein